MPVNMVDLAYTAAERKKERAEISAGEPPKYPWGLCIRLEQDTLDKLGIKDLPNVDQEVHIIAVGVITGVNSNHRTGDDPESSVAIQITGMQLMVEPPEPGEERETMADENSETRQMVGGNVLSNTYRRPR